MFRYDNEKKAYQRGFEDGKREGYQEAYQEGFQEGFQEGYQEEQKGMGFSCWALVIIFVVVAIIIANA